MHAATFVTGELFGLKFHLDILIMSWVVMAVLTFISLLATRKLKREPYGLQNILETVVQFLQGLLKENIGPKGKGAFPFVATLFLFILFSNLLGLLWPGVTKSPTEDLNVTIALALLVFFSMVYYGIKAQGLKKYILSFFKPNFLFFPIHLIDFLVKPITLAFRLFGNIFAGAVFIQILNMLIKPVIPVVGLVLGVFVGVIQAYLFLMLSMAYIASAMEEESAAAEHHPEPSPALPDPGADRSQE
ncbi:MAG TPA: F0F1 ATP synthase subunit A [Bacillota bacterium]